jgi:hypothetical protein
VSSADGGGESDLAFIQRCVREGRLLWTYHVNMRLRQRGVTRLTVTESVDSYEIIEHYPQSQTSRYLPSYLVYAEYGGEASHILLAVDREGDAVRVITVYRPDPAQWEAGFRRRKKS